MVLKTNLAKISMNNPFMLASGVLGVTSSIITRVANLGCGAIVTKSIGPEPKEGYKNPTIVELGDGSTINAMGLPNPGCKSFLLELIQAKKMTKVPIITSIFGKTKEEFIQVATTLTKGKPDGIELNISCPHGGRYGAIIGQDSELVREITKEVKQKTKLPVFVKISPNLTDITAPAKATIEGGADGLVAINTVRAMAIDIKYRKPILSNKSGGLSGSAIKPIAVKCIYDLYSTFQGKIPIIGVGGVAKWQDAIELFLAGATAIQVGTAIAYCDNPLEISIFKELKIGVEQYLKEENFKDISEIIGLAHD